MSLTPDGGSARAGAGPAQPAEPDQGQAQPAEPDQGPSGVTRQVAVPDRRPPGHGRQLSLFGIEARAPAPGDLEGLLAGGAQVVRMGGTARISVVVDAPWRAALLVGECAQRGVAASLVTVAEDRIEVRTAYSAVLAPLGAAWLQGTVKRPPMGFALDGRRLRLWLMAGGSRDGAQAYLLPLGRSDEQCWPAVGAALAGAGLPGVLLSHGSRRDGRSGETIDVGGPAYRIVGRRRLARLAELVGEAPRKAPAGAWP